MELRPEEGDAAAAFASEPLEDSTFLVRNPGRNLEF